MGLFGSNSDEPPDPIKEQAEKATKLMNDYDLFGAADLLCQNDPKDWPKIGNKSTYPAALEFNPDGSFQFRLGDARFRSVTVSPESCKNMKK